MLHLDIETFYLFAKILLDRIADTFGFMFGVDWKSSGSSHSDLSKRFETLCRDKGLEIRPDNLPALISKLSKAVVDLARVGQGVVNGLRGDLMKHEAMDGHFRLEHFT